VNFVAFKNAEKRFDKCRKQETYAFESISRSFLPSPKYSHYVDNLYQEENHYLPKDSSSKEHFKRLKIVNLSNPHTNPDK
jgi:hypothetical protein